VSPLYGVRQRLTPSHGAACESWPWPWAALVAPWLPATAPCDPVVAAVWDFAIRAELLELILLVRKRKSDPDALGWRPFGCGATKKSFFVSLVPKLYKRKKEKYNFLYWINNLSF